MDGVEIMDQGGNLLRIVRIGQCRAPYPDIHPVRVHGYQQAHGLCDFLRLIVGQEDRTGADADSLGAFQRQRSHHFRGGTGKGFRVVVLGKPDAVIAQVFGFLG